MRTLRRQPNEWRALAPVVDYDKQFVVLTEDPQDKKRLYAEKLGGLQFALKPAGVVVPEKQVDGIEGDEHLAVLAEYAGGKSSAQVRRDAETCERVLADEGDKKLAQLFFKAVEAKVLYDAARQRLPKR